MIMQNLVKIEQRTNHIDTHDKLQSIERELIEPGSSESRQEDQTEMLMCREDEIEISREAGYVDPD